MKEKPRFRIQWSIYQIVWLEALNNTAIDLAGNRLIAVYQKHLTK